MRLSSAVVALALVLIVSGCGEQQRDTPPEDEERLAYEHTVVGTAEVGGAATFADFAGEAGLAGDLARRGPYTLFAPSDEAFGALGSADLDRLRGDRGALTAVTEYHILDRLLMSGEMEGDQTISTMHGEAITISATDEGVTITDALGNTVTVTTADLEADNGVVHVIDGVLLPATLDELVTIEEFTGEDVEYDDEPIME